MIKTFLSVFTALFLCSTIIRAGGIGGLDPELQALVSSIDQKRKAGPLTEADLADELKTFEMLMEKHKGEKTEDAAHVAYLRAAIYLDILADEPRGFTLLTQVTNNYPDTKTAQAAGKRLAMVIYKDKLVVGAKFPDFFALDQAGKPLGLASYRGEVVLVNFWASWSMPCVAEASELAKIREAHHGEGFEVIGINLDKQKDKMENFLATNKMAWPQIFDEGGRDRKIAPQCTLTTIPMNFLLDGEGNIIARDIHGDELEEAVAKVVATK